MTAMKTALGKNWRDSAALIVLSKRAGAVSSIGECNYDVLLQTRTEGASFGSSAVFPGGVVEAADASPEWTDLLGDFGYGSADLTSFHNLGSPFTPIFRDDPVQRHLTLRIAAIRETFEELGLLLCSRTRKEDRAGVWASIISDTEVTEWQKRVSENPGELLNLCRQFHCYPDVWSLHYLSNWLTPAFIRKRFDTAFFVTALQDKPQCLTENKEVAKVEWSTPSEVLSRSLTKEVLLYPPQSYELNRLARYPDIEQLIELVRGQSRYGSPLYYHSVVRCVDGTLFVLPGDDLYPSAIDLNSFSAIDSDKTVLLLRETSKVVHRFELKDSKSHLVFKNYKPNNMDMGDTPIEVLVTLSKSKL